jgi:hypothetical protein
MPARHLEAGDLVTPVLRRHAGLEEAGAHRVQRLERIAGAEQRVAPRDRAPRGHHGVELVQLVVGHAHGQAQFAQVAARTGDLERFELDASGGLSHDGAVRLAEECGVDSSA